MLNKVILKAERHLVGISPHGASQGRRERFAFPLLVTWAPRSLASVLSYTCWPSEGQIQPWCDWGLEGSGCLFRPWAELRAPEPWMASSLWRRRQGPGGEAWKFDPTGIFVTSGRPKNAILWRALQGNVYCFYMFWSICHIFAKNNYTEHFRLSFCSFITVK